MCGTPVPWLRVFPRPLSRPPTCFCHCPPGVLGWMEPALELASSILPRWATGSCVLHTVSYRVAPAPFLILSMGRLKDNPRGPEKLVPMNRVVPLSGVSIKSGLLTHSDILNQMFLFPCLSFLVWKMDIHDSAHTKGATEDSDQGQGEAGACSQLGLSPFLLCLSFVFLFSLFWFWFWR